MNIKNLPIITIEDCYTNTDVVRKLHLVENGKSLKLVKDYISAHNLNCEHFKAYKQTPKYKRIIKICPVCSNSFETLENHKREKTTCSYACSNTYFRSKEKHPNYTTGVGSYRNKILKIKCNRCEYKDIPEILQIHHIDRNRANNCITNLEVLCPNCHCIEHYVKQDGIYTK